MDKISWWPIGEVTFDEGKYSFSDLAYVEKNTFTLKFEKYYHSFALDVDPSDLIEFGVEETTKLKVYVIV
jgi:hypothetical protein